MAGSGKTVSQRVEALKQTVEEVCMELASLGEESLFMSINLRQRSCFYLGSEPGKEFLGKRMDVIENFYHFINTSYPLSESDLKEPLAENPNSTVPEESGDAPTSQDLEYVATDATDENSVSIIDDDPDYIPDKRESTPTVRRGRPPATEDGNRISLIQEMEKTIMGATYVEENSQESPREATVARIEKIVTNDFEYVKSLKHKHKAIYVCADCNAVCSWKRSMMTHLLSCKARGGPNPITTKLDESAFSTVSQGMTMSVLQPQDTVADSSEHEVILSIVEEDKSGTQTTTTKQVVLPKFSGLNDDSLAQAVASIVDSQAESTKSIDQLGKPQTSEAVDNQTATTHDQDFQQAVELIESLQKDDAHHIEELKDSAADNNKNEQTAVAATKSVAAEDSLIQTNSDKQITQAESAASETPKNVSTASEGKEKESKERDVRPKEKKIIQSKENKSGEIKHKDQDNEVEPLIMSVEEGEPQILSALTLKSAKSPVKSAKNTPVASPSPSIGRSRRQIKVNRKYADFEVTPIRIKKENKEEPNDSQDEFDEGASAQENKDQASAKKETRGRKRKMPERDDKDQSKGKDKSKGFASPSTRQRQRGDSDADESTHESDAKRKKGKGGDESSDETKTRTKKGRQTATEEKKEKFANRSPRRMSPRGQREDAQEEEDVEIVEGGAEGNEEEEEENEDDDEADDEIRDKPKVLMTKGKSDSTSFSDPFTRKRGRPRKIEAEYQRKQSETSREIISEKRKCRRPKKYAIEEEAEFNEDDEELSEEDNSDKLKKKDKRGRPRKYPTEKDGKGGEEYDEDQSGEDTKEKDKHGACKSGVAKENVEEEQGVIDDKTSTKCTDSDSFKRRQGRPEKSETGNTIYFPSHKNNEMDEGDNLDEDWYPDDDHDEHEEESISDEEKNDKLKEEIKTKDQATSTPCTDPSLFKRRRGRPRKSETDDIIYFPPIKEKGNDDAMEEDWYPDDDHHDDDDFKKPSEEVPKKKSNRGRKKKNRAPLDPNRYRITSDDLQEAFRNGEEKGEFTCKECGENYTWKRSYMRHLEAHVQVNEGKDKFYDCKVCKKIFVSEWEMKNHLRGKHKMLFVFDCDTCPRKFHTAIQFKNHKVNCTKENPNTDPIEDDPLQKFTCNYCLMKFKSEQQLETHKELHNIVEYRCEECGRVFPEAYRLKNHVRDTHDKTDTYVCDVCEKHFTSARYLHRHRTCVHHKTESICRTCGKLFPSKSELRLHIKIEHEEPDATICPICKVKFPSEKALDIHRPEHYNFQCETCGKKFQKLVKLRDHVRSHTNDYPFWCKNCNKGFTTQTNLENHFNNTHANKVYICSTCGSIFKNPYTLKNHMKVHTDAADFACKFCDSTYRTGEGLKNHMIENHMTEDQIRACNMQVWKCDYCEKVFGRRQHYERHRDQHLGVKKYKCPECSLGFFSQYHLNRHMKSHLSYTPTQKRIRRPNFKVSSTITGADQEEETEEIPEGTEIVIDNTMIAQEQDTEEVTETVYVTAFADGQEDGSQPIQYTMPQGTDQQMLEFVVINYPPENSNEVGITTTEVGMASTEEENDVVQSILNLQDGIIADTSSTVVSQPAEPSTQ